MSSKLPRPQLPSPFTPFLRRFTDERARDLAGTTALYHEVGAAFRASAWSDDHTIETAADQILTHVAATVRLPSLPLLRAFAACLFDVLAAEITIFGFPNIDFDNAVLSLKDQVDLRRFLRAKQHFLANDALAAERLTAALTVVFAGLIELLPEPATAPTAPPAASCDAAPAVDQSSSIVETVADFAAYLWGLFGATPAAEPRPEPEPSAVAPPKPAFTVPLIALLPDPADTIDRIIGTLHTQQHAELGLFTALTDQIYRNVCRVSGVDPDSEHKKPLVLAGDAQLAGEELAEAYLAGTPFLELLRIPIPFQIPISVRNEHFLMVARTGSGKTQYIQRDILDNLLAHDSPGMVVIDSQNQMIPKLEQLQAARDRIVIIDPFDPSPPALNMFLSPGPVIDDPHLRETMEANTLQQFAWIFSALDQELTGRQTTLFTFTARVLLAMGANMQTLLELMRIEKPAELKRSPFWPYIESSDEQTRYFFENRFCTNDYNRTKGGVADRLLGVLRVPAFNRMFMASANRLDLHGALAARKLIVFNTHKSRLGNDASAILGRYAISLYVRAAFQRELEQAPPPAMLYVDEASEYFGKKDSSDVLFTQLRKYNAGTFVAFQDLSQLGEQLHTLIANTSTKITGGLTIADARRLAPDMRTTDEELMSIRKIPGAFDFMCYINNVTPRAVRLTFEYGAVEHAPQLTAEEHRQLRQRNRDALSVPLPTAPSAQSSPPSITSPKSAPEPPRPQAAPQAESPVIKPGKDW